MRAVTDPEAILDRLNPKQREAATAVRGPVAILAGAGTGKTTTITHRIAYQVASGAFSPAELMLRIFDGYERRKRAMGRVDFEDMLGLTVRLFDEHPEAAVEVRDRYRAFTVDEYQDVNPLQAALLDRWLGERDELCVVGDDYQTIYGFAGATPEYLLKFERRFPAARLVRLEENYRSTPEVLAVANRLSVRLG